MHVFLVVRNKSILSDYFYYLLVLLKSFSRHKRFGSTSDIKVHLEQHFVLTKMALLNTVQCNLCKNIMHNYTLFVDKSKETRGTICTSISNNLEWNFYKNKSERFFTRLALSSVSSQRKKSAVEVFTTVSSA